MGQKNLFFPKIHLLYGALPVLLSLPKKIMLNPGGFTEIQRAQYVIMVINTGDNKVFQKCQH